MSKKRSTPEQLPFFQDYVSKILRPKIEDALENVKHDMHGAIWSALVQELAESGENAGMDTVELHEFLEQQLGLWIKISIQAGFSTEQASTGTDAAPSGIDSMMSDTDGMVEGQVVSSESGEADPVAVRRSGSGSGRPLVSAVARHGTKD